MPTRRSGAVRDKGAWFWLNLSLLATGVFVLVPLLNRQSQRPFLLSYSLGYLMFLVVLALLLSAAFVTVCLASADTNRYVFWTFVLTLAFTEAAVRLAKPYVPHLATAYGTRLPVPYVMFSETRDQVPDRLEKPPGEIRIFVLGGSTVYEGNPSIPGEIERLFHQDGHPGVKVYNFGAISFVSAQELALLVHKLVDYRPDAVIVYDGGNDIFQPYFYDPRPGYPYNFLTHEAGVRLVENRESVTQALGYVLSKSEVVRSVFRFSMESYLLQLGRMRREAHYRAPEWGARLVQHYVRNLDTMRLLAEGSGFKLGAFLQPVITFKSPLVGREHAVFAQLDDAFHEHMRTQYATIRTQFDALGRACARKADPSCLFSDLSLVFQGENLETFTDLIHIDANGNRHVASQMHRQLRRWVIP